MSFHRTSLWALILGMLGYINNQIRLVQEKLMKIHAFILLLLALSTACVDQQYDPKTVLVEGKAVLGEDDRLESSRLKDQYQKYTYRVGELISRYDKADGKRIVSRCTAALINEKYVLTAAHCAFNSEGRLHQNQFFYPGVRKDRTTPRGKYRVAKVYMPSSYRHGGVDDENDMAVMLIEENDQGQNAGERAGSFGYWGKHDFPNQKVVPIGYPGDKQAGYQYFEPNCEAERRYPDRGGSHALDLDCDVIPGQSGSPLLVYSSEHEDYYIQGVITSESPFLNYGSWLSRERSKIIQLITQGKFDSDEYKERNFNESWKSYTYEPPRRIHIYVKNVCQSKDLYLAYNYKDDFSGWTITGYKVIPPFGEIKAFETNNTIFYLRALTENGDRLTTGDLIKRLPINGRNVSLQKFRQESYGNKTYRFGCY